VYRKQQGSNFKNFAVAQSSVALGTAHTHAHERRVKWECKGAHWKDGHLAAFVPIKRMWTGVEVRELSAMVSRCIWQ